MRLQETLEQPSQPATPATQPPSHPLTESFVSLFFTQAAEKRAKEARIAQRYAEAEAKKAAEEQKQLEIEAAQVILKWSRI